MKKINAAKALKKYETGGQIDKTGLAKSALSLGLNAVAPGTGAIVAPVWDAIQGIVESKSNAGLTLKPNPNIYAFGGKLEGSLSPGVAMYNGPAHKFGGIMITKDGVPSTGNTGDNVEGGEVLVDLKDLGRHVFSKRLKVGK